jgi:hypothetical protein
MFAWFQVWLIPLALVGGLAVLSFYFGIGGRWPGRDEKSPLDLAKDLEDGEDEEPEAQKEARLKVDATATTPAKPWSWYASKSP